MTTTSAHLTPVRQFEEDRVNGRPRWHVLAIYDTGQLRLLIDRGERMATRLLTILNDGQEHECLDGPPQIAAVCNEYVRQYRRVGGPLACRLTREHLRPARSKRHAAPPRDAARRPAGVNPAVEQHPQPGGTSPGMRSNAVTPAAEDALEDAA
jgi:hypothetical protein